MTHLRIELPEDLAESLRRIATETQSTTEAVLIHAARELVAAREELARMIARGEADIAAGRVVPHDAVMREMQAWAAEIRARRRPA